MLINLIKTRNACLSFSLAVSQVLVKITKLFQTNKDYVKRFKITIRVNTGCLSSHKKMLEKEGRKISKSGALRVLAHSILHLPPSLW